MKTRTATLLSIAGVLAASSVAAIVNAQVLDTGDDSRTPVPAAVTTTIAVDDPADSPAATDPAVTLGSVASTDPAVTLGSIALTTVAEPTATSATDPSVPVGGAPLDPSPIAPLATTASGQTEFGAGTNAPAPTAAATPAAGTVGRHDADDADDSGSSDDADDLGGDDRSGDDD